LIQLLVGALLASGQTGTGTAVADDGTPPDVWRAPVAGPLPASRFEQAVESPFHFVAGDGVGPGIRLLDELEPFSLAAMDDVATGEKPPFGTKDSLRFNIFGGYGTEPDDTSNKEYLLGVAWELFIEDHLSLSVELNNFYFDQSNRDGYGFNLNFLMRWYMLRWEKWSFYGDLGAGMMLSTDEVPNPGSSFNFTPQLGAGIAFDIGGNNRLLMGGRWHHISNARLYSDNPGQDNFLMYVGLSVPW
jgi:hypothetical protein